MEHAKPTVVSKETVRRFLVSKQIFGAKRGKEGVLEAVKQLECVQLDPISVVRRNHHLVLHNRVVDYQPSYLEELLYKDRRVFEYWCNEKSIIPIEDFPYFRYRMLNPSQFHSPFYERAKAKRNEWKGEIAYVMSEIEKYGASSAQEFAKKGKIKGGLATRILNLLWDCGDLMIHHVKGNRRYYDLTERIVPSKIMDERVPRREEYVEFLVRKYMRAYGLVDVRDWRFGWLPLKASERKAIVNEMVEEGFLHPVKVEAVKHLYYVLKEDLVLLENLDREVGEDVFFLAPLDNLLWNRRMISEVFGFEYTWEVYKVPEKRVYGYYAMPILCGTSFVGRLDPKLDRQNGKMIIRSLFLEKGKPDRGLIEKIVTAMKRFLEFHEVSQISVEEECPRTLRNMLTAI